MYQNPYYQNRTYPMSYPSMNNGINWVQGVEGAKAFQMMPNSNAILMDSDLENIFYIKVSDNVGMCNLRTFKYEEITDKCNKNTHMNDVDLSDYVTKQELQSLIEGMLSKQMEDEDNGKQSISTTDHKRQTIKS